MFIDTSNNAWYSQVHWLIMTPFLSTIASNEQDIWKYLCRLYWGRHIARSAAVKHATWTLTFTSLSIIRPGTEAVEWTSPSLCTTSSMFTRICAAVNVLCGRQNKHIWWVQMLSKRSTRTNGSFQHCTVGDSKDLQYLMEFLQDFSSFVHCQVKA